LQSPRSNIGIATGPVSGFWALDVDAGGFETLQALIGEHGQLPPTVVVGTPSGGAHFYFAWDAARPVRNRSKFAPGLDVRGKGGYVVAPALRALGARWRGFGRLYVAGGAVADHVTSPAQAPDWLTDEVLKRAPRRNGAAVPKPPRPASEGRANAWGEATLTSICNEVSACPPGAQNDTLFRKAARIGSIVAGGSIDQGYARDALISSGMRMTNGVADDPWTLTKVTDIVIRGMAFGAEDPTPPPSSSTAKRTQRQTVPVEGATPPADEPEAEPLARKANGHDPGTAADVAASPMSEDAVALAFAAEHAGRLRYDHRAGWYVYKDGWWQRDETRLGFDWCRRMAREHAWTANEPSTRAAMGKKAFAAGVESLAQADQRLAVTPSVWNPDPWLAGVPGGALNLKTGKVCPATPEDMITRRLACPPADVADCPLWDAFMGQFCEGDDATIRLLEQWAGMCLSGDTSEQKLLILNGPGGNGKGVFVQMLSRIFGDYAVEAAPDTFTATRNEQHSTNLAMLAGARLVTTAETEAGRSWAESRIKAMTGGDRITARFMRRDNFTYTPAFKVIISTNSPPVMSQIDDALRRRFLVVPCRFKPEKADLKLGENLWAERAGILRRLVDAGLDWQMNGLLAPGRVLAETATYFSAQDSVQQWLDENCDVDPDRRKGTALSLALFRDWERFANDRGEDPHSNKWLTAELIKRGFRPPEHKRSGALWHGLSQRPTGPAGDYRASSW
jgi:putative DNA primase/helicase